MPAGSDGPAGSGAASAVRTWRPFGTRIAGALGITVLVVASVVTWFLMGPRMQAAFTWPQQLTVVGLFGTMGLAWWAMARSRLTADDGGVTVVNGYRRRHYDWAQVVAFRLRRGAPWAELDLSDGESLAVFGVQGSDGDRARAAVREFRAMLAAHSPEEPGTGLR